MSKITPKFQVTIPTDIRSVLGANAGDRIMFLVNHDGEVVIRTIKEVPAKELAGSLRKAAGKVDLQYVPLDEARRLTADELAEEDKRGLGLHTDATTDNESGGQQ